MAHCAYIFLDESGNFDFSVNGTRYFVLASVAMRRPLPGYVALDAYKYDCVESGLDIEYFHCANDSVPIRNRVFDTIADHLDGMRIDSLVVEKRKTAPPLREDRRFYPAMLVRLLQHVLPKELEAGADEFIVITDTIPVNKKRRAVEKGVQLALAELLPKEMKYRILHHQSRSHYGLQIADYGCWAIFRKWQKDDKSYYDRVGSAVRSEMDIFQNRSTFYY